MKNRSVKDLTAPSLLDLNRLQLFNSPLRFSGRNEYSGRNGEMKIGAELE